MYLTAEKIRVPRFVKVIDHLLSLAACFFEQHDDCRGVVWVRILGRDDVVGVCVCGTCTFSTQWGVLSRVKVPGSFLFAALKRHEIYKCRAFKRAASSFQVSVARNRVHELSFQLLCSSKKKSVALAKAREAALLQLRALGAAEGAAPRESLLFLDPAAAALRNLGNDQLKEQCRYVSVLPD